jgi:molecular chaperone HscB
MTICWSCDRDPSGSGVAANNSEASPQLLCVHCGALQPPSPDGTSFDALGLPRSMGLTRAQVEKAFRTVSRTVHPDRFRAKSAVERRLALEHTTRVNEGYRILKVPRRRAEYLLSLAGHDLGSEEQRTEDSELLMAMMERTEAIDAARDVGSLEKAIADLQSESRAHLETARAYFDDGVGELSDVIRRLEHNRYLVRLLERAEARLEDMQ